MSQLLQSIFTPARRRAEEETFQKFTTAMVMVGGGMVGVEMVGVDMEGVVMGGEANRGAEREVGKGDRGKVSLVSHICMESSFNLSG